jgi:tetratricopeptide (TPR) repeat protein
MPMAVAPPSAVPPTPAAVRGGVAVRRVDGPVAAATREGNKALLAERPDDALAHYSKAQVEAPDVPEIEYNRGLAALLAGDAPEAAKAFALAQQLARPPAGATAQAGSSPATQTPPELLEDSRFNLGHAAWAQDQLPEAIQGWASILAKDPGSDDARRNLELALRLLAQQQQEQQQQEPEEQEPKDEDESEEEKQPQDQQPGEDEQQPQGGKPDEQAPPGPDQQQAPGQMTKEQAEDLLEALEAVEKQAMREDSEKQARRLAPVAGKDW